MSTEGLPHPPPFERGDVAHPEGEVLVDEVAEERRAHHALQEGGRVPAGVAVQVDEQEAQVAPRVLQRLRRR